MNIKLILIVVLIFASLISGLVLFAFGSNSSFYSQKCNSKIMPITGEFIYREQIVKELQIIENNCDYLNFISENVVGIYAENPGLMNAGEYHGGSFKIYVDPYAASEYISAGIIIHETCHAYQDKKNMSYSEEDCTTTEYNFLKNIGAPKKDIELFESRNKSHIALLGYTTNGNDVFEMWKLEK